MHIAPMPESAGVFAEDEKSERSCPKCGGEVRVKKWESKCGGYEDYKYTCTKCNHYWWVEGIDS